MPRDGEQQGGHQGAGGSLGSSRRRLLGKENSFAEAWINLKKQQLWVKDILGSPGHPLCS